MLIAVNNRYGIKVWKGTDDYRPLIGQFDENSIYRYSKRYIKEITKNLGLNNSKFYYIFPEYKAPNLIYTDEHKITLEDISRNFELNEIEDENNFGENEVLNQILKDSPEKMNFFANSFFVEISKAEIVSDVKYVTFTNYRLEDKQIQTIIKTDKVLKRAINEKSKSHIQDILSNMQYFPKEDCKLLDRKKDDYTIESDFIYGKRLDEIIEESSNPEEEFDKYKKLIFKNIIKYDDISKTDLLEIFSDYDDELLKRLNFVEHAFIDMIPKNCFIVGGVNFFFDQEWMLKFLPAEFILYRAIRNTTNIDKEKLYKYYELQDFIGLFNNLEDYIRDMIIDKNILLNILSRCNNKRIHSINNLKNEVTNKDIAIENYKNKTIDLENIVKDRENQLAIIRNSMSWKITKPLRIISKWIRNILRKNK